MRLRYWLMILDYSEQQMVKSLQVYLHPLLISNSTPVEVHLSVGKGFAHQPEDLNPRSATKATVGLLSETIIPV